MTDPIGQPPELTLQQLESHLWAAANILRGSQAFEDVEDRARVVDLKEIEQEDWTLNISRYVLPPIGKDIPPLHEAITDFKAALARCREAEDALRREIIEGDWIK